MSTFENPLTEYSPQMEIFEFSPESGLGQTDSVLTESQQIELATQFLEVSHEQDLEQFLGSLIKGVGSALGKVVHSPLGQAIGSVLKAAAQKALPIAGGALGGLVGGPLGASLGSGLASMAGHALGLELEGLSPEDRDFEASKQFVKFAAETVKNALDAPWSANPEAVAHHAAVEAAREFAPGLIDISNSHPSGTETGHKTGRWIRHHGKIILFEV